jgi:peroxiredoxin
MANAQREHELPPKATVRQQRIVWIGTLAVAAIVAALAGLLAWHSRPPAAPGPAPPSAADMRAPRALRAAADRLDYVPEPIPGMGAIEDEPASAAHPPSNRDLLAAGTPAPGFTLRTPLGETVSLAGLRGRTLLIEFFTTWCPHCQAEAPYLERLHRRLDPARFSVIGINADSEDAASVFAYHRYFGLTFPALLDQGSEVGSWHSRAPAGPVTSAYRVQRFPTFYVIDAKHTVAWASIGEQPTAKLVQELRRAAGS